MIELLAALLIAQQADVPKAEPDLPKVPESENWRAKMPESATPRAPVLPKFETAKLDNGLTVMVANAGTLPLVSFNLVTRGGSALDPKDKAGLTALTYAMLEEGAGNFTALEFSDRYSDLGAQFSSAGDRDRGDVMISGLARNADAMLGLLTDAVRRPRLEEADFQRLKQQTLASLLQQRSSPQGLAFEAFPALVYGAEHPFGHPPSGVPESVATIALTDVKAQHDRVFGPNTSALVASGAITLSEAVALAKKHLGDWNHQVPDAEPAPEVAASKRTKIVVIDKSNSPQSIAIIGRPLFGRGHPDEVPLTLINEVYGGNFSARLNMNLREEKGYTYGASSQVAFRRGVGVFLAFAAIRLDATANGLGEFFNELNRLRTNRASADEIDRARSGIIRSLPGKFETTGATASAAAGLFVYELPLDYYDALAARYAAAPSDAIIRGGDTYLDPDAMKVLLVGEAKQIVGPLELLHLGEIEVRTVE